MTRSPQQYNEYFSLIAERFYSKEADAARSILSHEFSELAESLVHDFQSASHGMEGMMDFARENAFEHEATVGIWLSVGISAAHPGPRQPQWVRQAGTLIKNLQSDEAYRPIIKSLKDAFKMTLKEGSIAGASRQYPELKSAFAELLKPDRRTPTPKAPEESYRLF